MCIYLLGLMLVERDESIENVVACRGIVRSTFSNIRTLVLAAVVSNLIELAFIIREIIFHGGHRQLLLKSIDLVQEQDDGRFDKPPGVADRVEQGQSLLHPVHRLVLKQQLIILGNGHQEQDRGDIFKAMDPLLSLRSLTSHVEHTVRKFSDNEGGFRNTGRLDTGS